MATGSRTLTLKLLADIDNFQKNLKTADADTSGFSKSVEKFGDMAKTAFIGAAAAAGAYAVKIGVDGVKAAIEDEAAQSRLARTLQAATGATDEQIASTEKYISKMQLATGVADTDLRNALGRLSLSTNDLTKSQELLGLALDISKATGKDLDGVANALGKAYDGQTTALGKLGIGLSSAELKTMTFKDVQGKLSDLFGGAAAKNAETFQGKLDIMKQRFGEFEESVGQKVLPILMSLFTFFEEKLSPAFDWFKRNAIDPVTKAVTDNWDTFKGLFEFLSKTLVPFFGTGLALGMVALGKATSFVVDAVAAGIRALEPLINFAVSGINLIIRGLNIVSPAKDIPYVPKLNTSGVSTSVSTPSVPKISVPSSSGSSGSGGGVASAASSGAGASAAASSLNVASIVGSTGSAPTSISNGSYLNPIVVNVSGAIDPEGTARTIVNTLNSSFYRGTGGAGGLVYGI